MTRLLRPNADTLPDDTQSRIPLLIERSASDLDRPMLSVEVEKRLADVERRSAACYASLEDASARLHLLAIDIDSQVNK